MKRVGMIIFSLLVFLNVSCFASGEAAITVKQNTRTYLIEIEANGLNPFKRYSILVMHENAEPQTALTAEGYAYSAQRLANGDGKITLDAGFAKTAAGGKYQVLITAEGGEMLLSDVFDYMSETDVENAFKSINQASESGMQEALSESGNVLGFNMSDFSDASDSEKERIARIFFKSRPSGGFADIEEARESFGKAVFPVLVSNKKLCLSVIESYGGVPAEKVNKLNGEEKSALTGVLSEKSFDSYEAAEANIDESIFAAKCRAAKTAGVLQEYFLKTYYDILKPDLTAYQKLNNPAAVFAAMLNNSISGYDSALAVFAEKVKSQQKEETKNTNQSSGGTGGTGGGGTGGGGFPAVPARQTETADNEQKNDTQDIKKYSDTDSVPWAEKAISGLTEIGAINGYEDGSFRPYNAVTRAEFIKILSIAFGFKEPTVKQSFSDVRDGEWYTEYIRMGVENNIINGIGNGMFGVSDNITRQDLAVMCKRALEAEGVRLDSDSEAEFSDMDIVADYAKSAVNAFYHAGIVNGNESGAFCPQNTATRAEAAKIVFGLLQLKGDK